MDEALIGKLHVRHSLTLRRVSVVNDPDVRHFSNLAEESEDSPFIQLRAQIRHEHRPRVPIEFLHLPTLSVRLSLLSSSLSLLLSLRRRHARVSRPRPPSSPPPPSSVSIRVPRPRPRPPPTPPIPSRLSFAPVSGRPLTVLIVIPVALARAPGSSPPSIVLARVRLASSSARRLLALPAARVRARHGLLQEIPLRLARVRHAVRPSSSSSSSSSSSVECAPNQMRALP